MSGTVLPTTDLYFLNACGERVERWWRKRPVRRLGANCFAHGDKMLMIRHDEPHVIERALAWRGELIYLIDDDIDGAAQSPGLPASYRERLRRFAEGDYDRLLRRADRVVVSSVELVDRLADDVRVRSRPDRIDPFWRAPLAAPDHFRSAADAGVVDVVHLGSGSHGEALDEAAPAILSVLGRSPRVRFTFIGFADQHPQLETHPQVRRLSPMSWHHYRRWLPRQRFHLALYPLAPNRFDRARSVNKLIEHAIVGAVGVYPRDWAPAALAGSGAVTAPSDAADWEESLVAAVSDPRVLAERAIQAASAVASLNDPQRQTNFWHCAFVHEKT